MCFSIIIEAQIPTNGLTAYWPFSGSELANDYSGNNNNGTIHGATLTYDRFGNCNQAYKFDGISNYILVPNSPTVDMNNTDFTIAIWVKKALNDTDGLPLCKNQYGSWSGYLFFCDNSNGGYCTGYKHSSFYVAAGATQDACSNSAVDTAWHFYTGVYNHLTNQSFFYLDGVQQTDIGQASGSTSNSVNLVFGAHNITTVDFFTGVLDACRMYKRALTNAEILQLYNEPNPGSNSLNGAVKDTTICSTSSLVLDAGTASSYTWSTGVNTQTISVNNSGTYWVEIQSLNACKLTDTTHVHFLTPPPHNFLKDTTICSNVLCVLNESQSNATSYNWSTGATNSSINVATTGIYWVDLLINQCLVRDSVTVNILSAPVLSLINYTVCNGQSVNINPFVGGGTGVYTYNWGNGYSGASYSTTPVADSIYYVSVSDANGCFTSVHSGTITVLTPLKVNTNGTSTCASIDTLQVFATASGGTGNYTYTWLPSNTHQNPLLVQPLSTTIYTVTVSDGCSASVTDTAKVIITPAPLINLPSSVSGCKPVCVYFNNIPYDTLSTWKWNFGDGSSSSVQQPFHCFTNQGSYNVSFTYTTTLGCVKTVSSSSMVTVFPSPTAAFSASTFDTDVFNMEINFYNESSNYIISQWYFGDSNGSNLTNPSYLYLGEGSYPVTLIVHDQKGCTDTVIREVLIHDVFTFYAPAAFTPNGDIYNEKFLPIGTGWDNSSFKMLIYDRWGHQILSITNPNQGWDGKINGQEVQEDVYVWKVELKDIFHKSHSYSGTISVVK